MLVYACKPIGCQAFFHCNGSGCVHRAVIGLLLLLLMMMMLLLLIKTGLTCMC